MEYKVPSESVDITKQNIQKIKELFPEVLTDGEKIDFDLLRTVLGEAVEDNNERYSFNWHGKKAAILGAQKPSKGTLRPVKEKSKNFDTTENLYIEGDNLEVLKLLQKSYNNKIKMIYIDPPYNTGKDFVYKDNFKDGVNNYLEQTGQVDSDGNILSTNSESNGRFHTDWLNMIYPRLKLARNLLRDDGVIFISIDDSEFMNLKKLMNELFGEENFIAELVWDLGTGTQAGHFTRSHEYILVFAKKKVNFSNFQGGEGIIKHSALKKISAKNPSSDFLFKKGTRFDAPDDTELIGTWGGSEKTILKSGKMIAENGVLKEDVVLEAGWAMKNQMLQWFSGEDTIDSKGQKVIEFYFNSSGVLTYRKERSVVNPATVLKNLGSTKTGSNTVKELFDGLEVFNFPKPPELIKFLIKLCTKDDDIVLDFFSGSATTAHAVMKLNAEDGGRRRFILIQFPENLDESLKTAKDDAKKTIETAIKLLNPLNRPHLLTEIGEERIHRAGEKVKADLMAENNKAGMLEGNGVDPEALDIGFKVLKLDKSNIREWNTDFDNIGETIDLFEDMFVEGRSELDIVFEIMLKNGLELTYPVNSFQVDGKYIYDIAYGNLFICLDDEINGNVAKAIVAKRDEYGIETSTVVFKDAGFSGNDSEKLNCIELLKDAGYPEDNLLTI